MESNHTYMMGPITWDGAAINAVVITELTQEEIKESLVAGAVANYILAGNTDISAAPG